jgi:hypothetical protein
MLKRAHATGSERLDVPCPGRRFEPFCSAFVYLDKSTHPFALPDDLGKQINTRAGTRVIADMETVKLRAKRRSKLPAPRISFIQNHSK